MKYRADIQGLRAIAVLMVLIFHFNRSWLSGGFIGVDIFFVISGFLITKIILSKLEKSNFKLVDFYVSPAQRIVPAYYVAITIAMVVSLAMFTYLDAYYLNLIYYKCVAFVSNITLGRMDTYFAPDMSEIPFLHTWTLAIEMQFYFILPLILMFVKRKYLKFVLPFLIALLLSYAQYYIIEGSKSSIYFSLLARAPEFLIGSVVALVNKEFKNNLLAILSFVVLLTASILISEKSDFPGLLSLVPCVATSALILLRNSTISNKLLSHPIMVYIGELSYSIYLWHWIVLALMRYYVIEYTLSASWFILALALIVVLSILSYYFIEKATRKLSRKQFFAFIIPLTILAGGAFFWGKHVLAKTSEYEISMTTSFGQDRTTDGASYAYDKLEAI